MNWIVREEEAGKDVGFILSRSLGLSGHRIRSLKFVRNGILLDGKPVRTTECVIPGQTVSVRLSDPDSRKQTLLPFSLPLDILYEDAFLIAVNKPSGLAVHPSGGHAGDTLANALLAHFNETDPAARVHLAGRLDKDTSGIVLCAKNALTAEELRRALSEDGCGKTYLALAAGHFPAGEKEGTISLPLSVSPPDKQRIVRMQTDRPDGRAAVTRYRVEHRFENYALLSIRLDSGRMHQIRAHLAAIGHPLLGDPLYGDPQRNREVLPVLKRTALHAASVRFLHPFTREVIDLSAPLPEDMTAFLD